LPGACPVGSGAGGGGCLPALGSSWNLRAASTRAAGTSAQQQGAAPASQPRRAAPGRACTDRAPRRAAPLRAGVHARVPPFILPGPHHAGRAHRTGGYTVLTQFVRLLASAHVRLARPRRAPPPGCPGGALAVMAVMAWPGLFVPTVGRVLPAGVIRDEGWVPGCIIFSQLL